MRRFTWRLAALFSALFIAGCGGGDAVRFPTVVSFGDSISDAGTYKVGTIAGLGGGKFTVNGPDGLTWTEVLAGLVGAPSQCAAQTGMLPNLPVGLGVVGADVQNFANCFNYAQGSSRVSSSGTGPNGVALQTLLAQQNLGFMAISLEEQFEAHLTKIGGSYSGTELVTVNAGGNDLFMQLGAVGASFAGGPAARFAGAVAGWSGGTLSVVEAGGVNAVNAASAAAVGAMGQAGADLAGYIRNLVVAKGARYVLVRNLADPNVTPFGLAQDANTRSLITLAAQAFNSQLAAGLSGTPGVVIFDDYAFSQAIAQGRSGYTFSNVTAPSCGVNAFTVGFDNPSIVCNTDNLIAGDTSRYAFADSVHPTPYQHRVTAQVVLELMEDIGW